MARIKRGTTSLKRRRNVLAQTKGFRFGHKNKEKYAKQAIEHAGNYAFRDRRNKKRTMRGLWLTKINAALRTRGTTYSKFIDMLKKKNVEVDRKILAQVAEFHPTVFDKIVEEVK